MLVPPKNILGLICCGLSGLLTLVMLLHFNGDAPIPTPPVSTSGLATQPYSNNALANNGAFQQADATPGSRGPFRTNSALGDDFRSEESAALRSRDDAVRTVAFTDNGDDSPEGSFVNRLSAKDLAALQTLPPACTTDLPQFLNRQQTAPQNGLGQRLNQPSKPVARQLPNGRNVARPNDVLGRYPLNETPAVAFANQTLYNPHAKATQAGFTTSASPTTAKPTVAKPTAGPSKSGSDSKENQKSPAGKVGDGEKDPHLEIYSRDAFPSARECKVCHEQIFEEWASSSHAYASISPMFHVFEDRVNILTSGTIGYFCLRCHAPVATTMGLRRDQPIWDGPAVFREGVTCIACHRVKTPYTKTDGERRIEPGDIYAPVYGGSDGAGVATAAKYSDKYKVKTDRHDKGVGQKMHRRSIQFEELSQSSFCASCHQVAVKPGIKLEVVWDQYRASPACKEGVSCQDCHMGVVPGVDAGYSFGPAAVVDGKVVNAERKHSNHMFYGPGYSIAHPGIFPQTTEADKWTFNQWLEFDWRSDWGKEKFEDDVADGLVSNFFPPTWQNADDRVDAREIVTKNLKKLEYKKDIRRQLLENGSKLDGPFFASQPTVGRRLNFRYCLTNTNPGHNMPSGSLGAQPQLWMNAVLIDPSGRRIWETGYVDSNGDLADNHSLDVLARRIPLDDQLFNLQTKFLTQNVKGTDREMYLPVNFDVDQLPFIRPAPQPVTVLNHPPGIRMEGHSIPALGSRNAKFSIPGDLISQPGVYRLSVRMRSRAEPIYFMRFCFATPEMERMMNEWIADFHVNTVAFEVLP
jgi:nitrate/TMAO reductase-like tetraheme cytochrome c subunit